MICNRHNRCFLHLKVTPIFLIISILPYHPWQPTAQKLVWLPSWQYARKEGVFYAVGAQVHRK